MSTLHHPEIGDVVEVVGRHGGEGRLRGRIVAVRRDHGHGQYHVHWEDGHETTVYGIGGNVVIRPAALDDPALD